MTIDTPGRAASDKLRLWRSFDQFAGLVALAYIVVFEFYWDVALERSGPDTIAERLAALGISAAVVFVFSLLEEIRFRRQLLRKDKIEKQGIVWFTYIDYVSFYFVFLLLPALGATNGVKLLGILAVTAGLGSLLLALGGSSRYRRVTGSTASLV